MMKLDWVKKDLLSFIGLSKGDKKINQDDKRVQENSALNLFYDY